MKFHLKAIIGTLFFIIIYMVLANMNTPNEPFTFEWQKDLEISFSSITSIGALFWSLFALYRFQNLANFENMVQDTIKNISKFGTQMKELTKMTKIPGVMKMVTGLMGQEKNSNHQNYKKVVNKYLGDSEPELSEDKDKKKQKRDRAYIGR